MINTHHHDPESPNPSTLRRAAAPLALMVLLALHAGANLWWFSQDNHPIWGDEESHLLQARAYYTALTAPDAGLLARIHAAAILPPPYPAHPPLAHIAGAVSAILFGYGVNQMAAVSTVAFLLLLLGAWRLARCYLAPAPALFAVGVVSLTPGLFTSSRYFMTDYPLAALVVWLMALAAGGGVFLRPGRALAFGLLAGLAVLSRSIAPAYFLAPALLAFFNDAYTGWTAPERKPGRVVLRLLSCGVLSVLAAAAIAAPWHMYNRAAFTTFWFHQHTASGYKPLSFVESGKEGAQPAPAGAAKPAQSSPPAAPTGACWKPLAKPLINPVIPWGAYPAYVTNNGLFLPLALLFLAGVITVAARPRRRLFGEWLLVAWTLGGWMLLTLAFTIATPRYTLPIQAGLALLAALALLRIPWRPLRWFCGALLLCLLFYGYANLTFGWTAGLPKRIYIPCGQAIDFFAKYDDPGPCVFKDHLTLGGAYTWIGPPEKENYRERIYAAMASSEHEAALPRGGVALFGIVNARGLEYEAPHYWPGVSDRPNPLFNPNTPESLRLPRPLVLAPRVGDVEELTSMSETLDYIVCAMDASTQGRGDAWAAWTNAHEYRLLDQFEQARRVRMPARTFQIYAKKTPSALAGLASSGDVDALDRLDLMRLLNHLPMSRDAAFPVIAAARARLNRLMAAYPGGGSLNEVLGLHDITLNNDADGWTTCRLFVRGTRPMPCNYRVYLRGLAMEQGRQVGEADYGEIPLPPAEWWFPGEYAMMTARFPANMIPDVMEVYSQPQRPGSAPAMVRIDFARIVGKTGP